MDSIRKFKAPETKQKLKSWLGLCAQLTLLFPELIQGQSPMRQLLKKDSAWLWTSEMNQEFEKMRKLLMSKKYLKPFDVGLVPNIPINISKVHGWGTCCINNQRTQKVPA
jgi:hypothetical protein